MIFDFQVFFLVTVVVLGYMLAIVFRSYWVDSLYFMRFL